MDTSRTIPDTAASVTADPRQVTAPSVDAVSRARMLEDVSYDLALGIISLEIQYGETEQILVAREELQQMDERLTWVDHHRHHASESQVLAEVNQARINASHILEVLAIA